MTTKTDNALAFAQAHCDQRGTRLTEKRKQVLMGLLESDKALSAYELTEFCRDRLGFDLLPMSVYRILEFLEGEHLAHRLNLANKYVACSHITCDHEHEVPQFLICKDCFRVEEVGVKRTLINTLEKAIDEAGFHLASHQIELDCICEDCSREENIEEK
ncbi:MAG: transcriptional repressor [Pseudomonadota bacterium]